MSKGNGFFVEVVVLSTFAPKDFTTAAHFRISASRTLHCLRKTRFGGGLWYDIELILIANIELTAATRPYRAAPVWIAGLYIWHLVNNFL